MTLNEKKLYKFLSSRKLITVSTIDNKGKPWTSNMYYSVDKDFNFFFVSPTTTLHSQHIAQDPRVSFTVNWYNEKDLTDRKAIQATGDCKLIKDSKTIVRFLKNHHKYFPFWKDRITYQNMKKDVISSRPYVIKPKFIKYWDDEELGSEGTKEFKFLVYEV